jgi:hypothetical protein
MSRNRSDNVGGIQSTHVLSGELFSADHIVADHYEYMLNGVAYCKMPYEKGRPVDFVYVSTNRSFHTLTGLGQVKDKRVSEVIPGILESDTEQIQTFGNVASGGLPARFETYVDARKQWFEVSVFSPSPEHFVAAFDVITSRKRREVEQAEA